LVTIFLFFTDKLKHKSSRNVDLNFQCISIEDILRLHSIPTDKLLTVEDVYSITPDLLYQMSSCRGVEHHKQIHLKKSPPSEQGSYLSHL
jgi:hypothetical protein